MDSRQIVRSTVKWLGVAVGVGAASYTAYAGVTWLRYGKPRRAKGEDADELLDRFMPAYDVADRHAIQVHAPPDATFSAAMERDLRSCASVRGIFKARSFLLRSKPDEVVRPRGIIAETKSMGWGVLAEAENREIVMGAVTKPWEANPVFRALPPDEFASFEEPDYVKIAWTLRADPLGRDRSVCRTETRAAATDAASRKKFRWYWSFLSPGISLIRRAMLRGIKAEAKRRGRIAA